jgi:regulator of nucleoside diphosphate kinase
VESFIFSNQIVEQLQLIKLVPAPKIALEGIDHLRVARRDTDARPNAFFKELMMMRDHPIVIAESTARMLRNLLTYRAATRHDQEHLQELGVELDRALVLAPGEVPANVVTLRAAVHVLDLESGKRLELVLVSPAEADVKAGCISVLAPLGTALLGYREGDEVEWLMPGGRRRLRIERVVHASGDTGIDAGACGGGRALTLFATANARAPVEPDYGVPA